MKKLVTFALSFVVVFILTDINYGCDSNPNDGWCCQSVKVWCQQSAETHCTRYYTPINGTRICAEYVQDVECHESCNAWESRSSGKGQECPRMPAAAQSAQKGIEKGAASAL